MEIRRILNFQLFKSSPAEPYERLGRQHYANHRQPATETATVTYSSLRDHIQNVLEMHDHQSTAASDDSVDLEHTFNIANPDPMYVFVLPGSHHNRTLVLRRSYFDAAIFPNISHLQRQIMASNITRLYTLIENIEKIRPIGGDYIQQPAAAPEQQIPPTVMMNRNNREQQTDADAMRVVEENVRTERNFLKFMNYLNDRQVAAASVLADNSIDGSGGVVQPNLTNEVALKSAASQIEYSLELAYTTESPSGDQKRRISWKDFGLDGWVGGIKEPGKDFDVQSEQTILASLAPPATATTEKFTPTSYFFYQKGGRSGKLIRTTLSQKNGHRSLATSTSSPLPSSSTTLHYNMDEVAPTPSATPDIGRFVPKMEDSKASSPLPTHESWDVPMKIPHELNNLLSEEHLQSQNVSGILRSAQPKWPITSSRAAHKDEDVFIARANNPFGHSTKWTWSNSSMNISDPDHRTKRGALILYSMVKCSTGCDPLVYKGYGCYCGFLGSGRTLDGIDRCCKMHDYCYETAKCPMFLEYFVPYLWKCYRGRPLCAIDHGEWGGPGSCAARLCDCDQALAKCLRRFYCPRKRAVCSSSPWRLLQNVIMV